MITTSCLILHLPRIGGCESRRCYHAMASQGQQYSHLRHSRTRQHCQLSIMVQQQGQASPVSCLQSGESAAVPGSLDGPWPILNDDRVDRQAVAQLPLVGAIIRLLLPAPWAPHVGWRKAVHPPGRPCGCPGGPSGAALGVAAALPASSAVSDDTVSYQSASSHQHPDGDDAANSATSRFETAVRPVR